MNIITILLGLISAALYYFTKIDPFSQPELTLWLIEHQTSIGVPLWGIGTMLTAFLAISSFTRKKSAAQHSSLPGNGRDVKKPPSSTQPLPSSPELKVIYEQLDRLSLPESASIKYEPQAGVPFALQLRRSTPDVARRAIEALAAFLARTSTPPRVQIHFIDVLESGVPRKSMVQGALQKYLNRDSFKVISTIDGVELQFNTVSEIWCQ